MTSRDSFFFSGKRKVCLILPTTYMCPLPPACSYTLVFDAHLQGTPTPPPPKIIMNIVSISKLCVYFNLCTLITRGIPTPLYRTVLLIHTHTHTHKLTFLVLFLGGHIWLWHASLANTPGNALVLGNCWLQGEAYQLLWLPWWRQPILSWETEVCLISHFPSQNSREVN